MQKSERAWAAQGNKNSRVGLEIWGEALWHDDNEYLDHNSIT